MSIYTDTTVLIVDDDVDYRDLIAAEFEMKGCKTLLAANTNEALGLLTLHQIQVVVCDYLMPDVNNPNSQGGVELLTLLQELKRTDPERAPGVVCLITGYGDLLPPMAYHKGANGIFAKPVDRRALVRYVFEQLAKPVT